MNKKITSFDKGGVLLEAVGSIDELVSFLGWLKSRLKDKENVEKVQKSLMEISGQLVGYARWKGGEDVCWLEKEIEIVKEKKGVVRGFVLAGETEIDGVRHICRSVCRRAERKVISLSRKIEVDNN
ncbi:hypothetical protein DRH14_03845, partial [Candidatus Shapirobacteria bacterium]